MVLRQCDEILQRGRPLGGSALRGECSQLALFPCDPIEKRIKLVGLGEGPTDLIAFDPEEFVSALFG